MAFKRIVGDRKFWTMVALQGLAFAVIYQVITILFEYGGFEFSAFYRDKLSGGRWLKFSIGTLLAAFVYGFIISYGQFRGKIKEEERKNY